MARPPPVSAFKFLTSGPVLRVFALAFLGVVACVYALVRAYTRGPTPMAVPVPSSTRPMGDAERPPGHPGEIPAPALER